MSKDIRIVKKVIRYIILGVAFSFILLVIVGNIISHTFGYHKVDAFFPHVHYPIRYFKTNALQEITIESVYKNGFSDSVYVLHYTDSFKIILWTINQSNHLYFNNFIDTNLRKLVTEDYVPYERLSLFSAEIARKAFNHNIRNASIYFDNCNNIHSLINTKACQYYYLKAGAIYLISDANNYYDIYMGLNNSTYSDFMVYTTNNKLYIIALYSTTKSDVGPDALQKIINLPLK